MVWKIFLATRSSITELLSISFKFVDKFWTVLWKHVLLTSFELFFENMCCWQVLNRSLKTCVVDKFWTVLWKHVSSFIFFMRCTFLVVESVFLTRKWYFVVFCVLFFSLAAMLPTYFNTEVCWYPRSSRKTWPCYFLEYVKNLESVKM